ncbi:MAG: ComEC/Rec2 family competence protein [Parcubacteria group bacterium]
MKTTLNRKIASVAILTLAVLNFFIWRSVVAAGADTLHIHFFDVGQGDAVYIRTPAKQDILIDGGPDNSVLAKLGQAMPFYDRQIELMILTHPHADHLDGLVDILQRYEVEQVLYAGVEYKSAAYDEWQKLIASKNISTKIAQSGQTVKLGEAKIDILFPDHDMKEKTIKNLNNSSVIGRLNFGQHSFLLTGDAEQEVEKSLLDQFPSDMLKSDVFKAGHHGSDTSNTKDFLATVKPEIAVISVGEDNKYKHPANSTLQTFDELGIKLFRTDQDGDIECLGDGVELSCS